MILYVVERCQKTLLKSLFEQYVHDKIYIFKNVSHVRGSRDNAVAFRMKMYKTHEKLFIRITTATVCNVILHLLR